MKITIEFDDGQERAYTLNNDICKGVTAGGVLNIQTVDPRCGEVFTVAVSENQASLHAQPHLIEDERTRMRRRDYSGVAKKGIDANGNPVL